MKKTICVLLSLLMVFSLTACAPAHNRSEDFTLYGLPAAFYDPFAPQPQKVTYAEISDLSYDGIDRLKEALARMEQLCGEENALEELQQLYAFCYAELTALKTAETVASIQYDISTNSNKRKQATLETSQWEAEAATLYEQTMQAVLASTYSQEMTEYMGEDVAALFDSEISDFTRLAELLSLEDQLVKKYSRRATQPGFSPQKKGLDLAEIYLELVQLRKEIASLYGYESAADYYYREVYSRDYTPVEAADFHANVKKHLIPVYEKIIQTFPGKTNVEVDREEVVPLLQSYLPRISPEMAELFDDMVSRGMVCFADQSPNHMNGAYTTRLQQYAQPFIYNGISVGDYRALTYTAHEFGHYCDAALNGLYGAKNPAWVFDLAEVFSSGLEMLLYGHYDEMFGQSCSSEKTAQLVRFLETIIHGCMFDEAQQRVFAYDGELTVDAVNRIFVQTAAEYHMPTPGGSFYWTSNLHNFRYPFYYLSYAVAYTTSAELWFVAQTKGQQAAVDVYLEMLSMGSFEYNYSTVIKSCGLKGFGNERMLKKLAKQIDSEVSGLQTLSTTS